MDTERKKYKHDDIPVIHFNFDSGVWEPVSGESEQAYIAATYKNQLDAIEKAKAVSSSKLYESRAMRSEREAESSRRDRKSKNRTIGSFSFYALLGIAFLIIWWIMKH